MHPEPDAIENYSSRISLARRQLHDAAATTLVMQKLFQISEY